MDGSTGSTTFDSHWKSMQSWVGTNKLVFCIGYNVPVLFFEIYQKAIVNEGSLWVWKMMNNTKFSWILFGDKTQWWYLNICKWRGLKGSRNSTCKNFLSYFVCSCFHVCSAEIKFSWILYFRSPWKGILKP
jgi:hypothetical protein